MATTMLAPASRALLIVLSRVSLVMMRIGTVRFGLLILRLMACVSFKPPCGGSRLSQSMMSIFCSVKIWMASIELRASTALFAPNPRSMLLASMHMYGLGSATRITRSRRLRVAFFIQLLQPSGPTSVTL